MASMENKLVMEIIIIFRFIVQKRGFLVISLWWLPNAKDIFQPPWIKLLISYDLPNPFFHLVHDITVLKLNIMQRYSLNSQVFKLLIVIYQNGQSVDNPSNHQWLVFTVNSGIFKWNEKLQFFGKVPQKTKLILSEYITRMYRYTTP